jgi:hypothetical protein
VGKWAWREQPTSRSWQAGSLTTELDVHQQRAALFCVLICSSGASLRGEAPSIELEVAADPQAPFGAQQKWYGLLKELAPASLRLREARPGEEPQVESIGAERQPRYRVTAILDAKNQLLLPGARFTERDQGRLAEYLKTLQEEGIDGVTAQRGIFGLTEQQFTTVFDELSEAVGLSTASKRPREIVDAIADRLSHQLVIDQALVGRLEGAEPLPEELQDISRGTVLAIALRQAGLVFRPRIQSGELSYQVTARDVDKQAAGGRSREEARQHWPVGWGPEKTPVQTAPDLFEMLSAQIDGYSLSEALEAIGQRLTTPLVVDRASLRAKEISMDQVQVRLPAGKYNLERVLRRILSQGRLTGAIRVDEQGRPFYWITVQGPL